MIIYTQTPDYYQEYLEHGWLKDQAAKVHKYLERWRGKNGKWYYRYTNAAKNAGYKLKSKMTDAYVRFNRKRRGLTPDQITKGYGKVESLKGKVGGKLQRKLPSDDGRIRSGDSNQRRAAVVRSAKQYQDALKAGRARRAKKEQDETSKSLRSANLRSETAEKQRNESRKKKAKVPKSLNQENLRKETIQRQHKEGTPASLINARYWNQINSQRNVYGDKNDPLRRRNPKSLTSQGYITAESGGDDPDRTNVQYTYRHKTDLNSQNQPIKQIWATGKDYSKYNEATKWDVDFWNLGGKHKRTLKQKVRKKVGVSNL